MDLWKKLTLKVMFLLRTTSTLIFNLIRKKEDYEDIEEFEMISQLSYQSSNLHGIWKDPAPSSHSELPISDKEKPQHVMFTQPTRLPSCYRIHWWILGQWSELTSPPICECREM